MACNVLNTYNTKVFTVGGNKYYYVKSKPSVRQKILQRKTNRVVEVKHFRGYKVFHYKLIGVKIKEWAKKSRLCKRHCGASFLLGDRTPSKFASNRIRKGLNK